MSKNIIGKIVLVIFLAIILTGCFLYVNKKKDNNKDSSSEKKVTTESKTTQKTTPAYFPEYAVVKTDTTTERAYVSTGKIEPVDMLEQENFNGFSGMPKLGINANKKENLEQGSVLVSRDRSKAVVTIIAYDAKDVSNKDDESQPILRVEHYLCSIAEKSCQKTDILTQDYQGIEPKEKDNLLWSTWDSAKNLLFGHLVLNGSDASPVYVCDTQNKNCLKTEKINSLTADSDRRVVPRGSFSPSLDSFIVINQHDVPYVEKGKLWELNLYAISKLSEPLRTYDISAAIEADEKFSYDGVYSIAWSRDEKSIFFATMRKIFKFNLETEALSLIYTDPFEEESDVSDSVELNLDSSALFLSPDEKYLAFVDSAIDENEEEDATIEEDPDEASFNTLKRINLGNNNEVMEILSDRGLSLKLP